MSDFSIAPAHGPGWVCCKPCPRQSVRKLDGSWSYITRIVYFFAATQVAAREELSRRQRLTAIKRWPAIETDRLIC